MDEAAEEQDVSEIARNQEAQHRYLTWRAEKVSVSVVLPFCFFHLIICHSNWI